MKTFKSWRWTFRRKNLHSEGMQGKCGMKLRQLPLFLLCIVVLYLVIRTTIYQHQGIQMGRSFSSFSTVEESQLASRRLKALPRGIIHAQSDLERRPLWGKSSSKSKVDVSTSHNLLAMPVGIKQRHNVDAIVQKFLAENFTIILFHYDGKVDAWRDFVWNKEVIHIAALNQTKWWFAKRFLHPDIVSIYDYIFLWDEDLGVEHFHPRRYIEIVRSENLEISQPALDPNSTDIHHRITIRARTKKFHRRIYDKRGKTKCTKVSMGPPCTGFVEGMAPVFSRAAWFCAWHLIQNDLVHAWGVDMKLGYCAQGDRSKKVGIVDSEYVIHQGIQTLGGASTVKRASIPDGLKKRTAGVDLRVEIRRQSTREFEIFKKRWKKAVLADRSWFASFKTDESWLASFKTETKQKQVQRDDTWSLQQFL